ncbi:MAG: hypothetical protein R3234_13440, partial [Thermoanaerobaculia bacterium]|nr:hypothetical protein [Thermoanaerobaculia bacterium]
PEAMADVPGTCELPLTRAVVQYRDAHERKAHGGRIQDIGLGLVLEGRYASLARVVDLGSAQEKSLNLSSELVILDWIYEPTLDHVRALLETRTEGARERLSRYCFDLALRVLDRVGYGPLTRPTILRIGFRDLCRDLDLHEGTAVRILMEGGERVVRIHMDYDAVALVARTGISRSDPTLEEALREAFSMADLRRSSSGPTGSVTYEVRLPLPVTSGEARALLERVRFGLGHLLARFEPDRYEAVEGVLKTFGARETLARLRLRDPGSASVTLHRASGSGGAAVH